MLSYMLASPSQPSPSTLNEQKLEEAKRLMSHLPASGRNTSRRRKKDTVISKTFNPVASRPLSSSRAPLAQVSVNSSYSKSTWITTNGISPTYASEVFTVNAFAGAAAYLACFDQYRFDEIEVWLEPSISQGAAIQIVSSYATAIDVDDSNVPTAFIDVADHQSAICSNGEGGHYHKFKPHMAVALYSGVFTSFGNEPADWIDSASGGVQHYGLKFATTTSTTTPIPYNLNVRARISFRNAGI